MMNWRVYFSQLAISPSRTDATADAKYKSVFRTGGLPISPGKWIHANANRIGQRKLWNVLEPTIGEKYLRGISAGGGCRGDIETSGLFGYCTIFNTHAPRRGPINLPLFDNRPHVFPIPTGISSFISPAECVELVVPLNYWLRLADRCPANGHRLRK
jgi:hypothetical protein